MPRAALSRERRAMPDLSEQILAAVGRKSYAPLKPKALARKIGVPQKL